MTINVSSSAMGSFVEETLLNPTPTLLESPTPGSIRSLAKAPPVSSATEATTELPAETSPATAAAAGAGVGGGAAVARAAQLLPDSQATEAAPRCAQQHAKAHSKSRHAAISINGILVLRT